MLSANGVAERRSPRTSCMSGSCSRASRSGPQLSSTPKARLPSFSKNAIQRPLPQPDSRTLRPPCRGTRGRSASPSRAARWSTGGRRSSRARGGSSPSLVLGVGLVETLGDLLRRYCLKLIGRRRWSAGARRPVLGGRGLGGAPSFAVASRVVKAAGLPARATRLRVGVAGWPCCPTPRDLAPVAASSHLPGQSRQRDASPGDAVVRASVASITAPGSGR